MKQNELFRFRINIFDEITFYVNGRRWYLGPASCNAGYENKNGWITYPYNPSENQIIYIESDNVEKIANTIISDKPIEYWVNKSGMD